MIVVDSSVLVDALVEEDEREALDAVLVTAGRRRPGAPGLRGAIDVL